VTGLVGNVSDPYGCLLCGLPEPGHGNRYGLLHFKPGAPATYVAPDELTVAARKAVKTTHLTRAQCRCGAVTWATPQWADRARCAPCIQRDVSDRYETKAAA
jgi:hypothetical protein